MNIITKKYIVKFGTANVRGLKTKIDALITMIEKNDLDFLFITETWWDAKNRTGRGIIEHNLGPQNTQSGHKHYGTCIMVNPNRRSKYIFEPILCSEEGKLQIFRWCGILFIGCHIPPPAEHDEHWSGIISAWMRKRKPHEPVVVLGDLNMRIGRESGDSVTNHRAKSVYPTLKEWGFSFAKNDSIPANERVTCVHGTGAGSIDDYIFFEPHRLKLKKYMVDDSDFGSDHLMIYCEMEFDTTKTINEAISYKSWNLGRLKKVEEIEKYTKHFSESHLDNFERVAQEDSQSQGEVDHAYQRMMDMIKDTAMSVIGQTDRTKGRIPLIHPLLPAIREQCKLLRKRCQLGDETAEEAFKELCLLRQEAVEMATSSMERNWSRFVERTDDMQSTELLKTIHSFKTARTRAKSNLLSCEDGMMGEYANHFERQFSPPNESRKHQREECTPGERESHQFFFPGMVKHMIDRYPNGKASGQSGIKMEMLKPLSEMLARPLATFFNKLVKIGLVPTVWCRALIIPVPKKPNSDSIKDHRPISLTEVPRKVFEACLLNQITNSIGHAHFAQGGFERGKGTMDQVASLNETMQEMRKHGKRPCVAFLDICAAYDSADRDVVHNRLLELGCPRFLTRIVLRLFDHNQSHVILNGKLSPSITHHSGLLQGSILSPTLYNCYIGGIQQKLIEANGGNALTSFWYADDAAIVAEDTTQLQNILETAQAHSLEVNFRFNPRKCEVLNCEGKVVKLYGEPIPECKEFKYLGVWFTGDGANWRLHFARRREKAKAAINFWRSVGMNGYGFKLRTKRYIYLSFIRPVFEYGLAICPDSVHLTKELQKTQADAMCALFGVGRSSSQIAMETVLGITSMKYRRTELKARWIIRMRGRDERHMTNRTRSQCKKQRLKRLSCFADEGENGIVINHDEKVEEERLVFEASGEPASRYRPRKLQRTILERRCVELRRVREETRHCGFIPIYDDCKARFIYALSRTSSITGRFLSNWLIGRYIGKPVQCLICSERDANTVHLMRCARVSRIDELAGRGKWLQAMSELMMVFDAASGFEQTSTKWYERHLVQDGEIEGFVDGVEPPDD